jgi:hypothetical protein
MQNKYFFYVDSKNRVLRVKAKCADTLMDWLDPKKTDPGYIREVIWQADLLEAVCALPPNSFTFCRLTVGTPQSAIARHGSAQAVTLWERRPTSLLLNGSMSRQERLRLGLDDKLLGQEHRLMRN